MKKRTSGDDELAALLADIRRADDELIATLPADDDLTALLAQIAAADQQLIASILAGDITRQFDDGDPTPKRA